MCKERYINPFTDFGFKHLFGKEANKGSLIAMLNSIIEDQDPIADITYESPEHLGMPQEKRYAVFDIYCVTESGAHIIVEMQNMYQRFYKDRSIYYSTFPIQEAARKGKWDYRLPKVYTISFLNFRIDELEGSEAFRSVIKLTDVATGRVFYDKLCYIYIELPKFSKELAELETDLDYWLYSLKNMDQMESVPEAYGVSEVFREFFKAAEVGNFTREQLHAYEDSLKAMRDNDNAFKTAIEDSLKEGEAIGLAKGKELGIAEGEALGLAKGKHEIAKAMLAQGMDINLISKVTGLSPEELGK